MSNLRNATMEATVYFEKDGKFIPMLSKTIRFKTLSTAQRSLKCALGRHMGNLHNFYGYGVEIKFKCLLQGSDDEIMNGNIKL